MYSPDITRQLQNITSDLLKESGTTGFSVLPDHITKLRQVLQFHEYRYYVLNDPLIADQEYDFLYKTLQKAEQHYPELITTDSPTQRVGNSLNSQFITVSHLVPMLSLDNSYNGEDLIDYDRKARELTGLDEIEYCIEPKFDGASISLIYENNQLVRAATRGDGVEGEEITANIRQIRSIPLSADFASVGIQQVEIRGEVIMSKQSFNNYNQLLASRNLSLLANPRNAASGSLRMKDPKDVGERGLDAFLYHISFYTKESESPKVGKSEELLETHSGNLSLLWQLGFRSPEKEKE